MNNKVFGIDLGTTYSCIAYIDKYDKPVVVKNAEGELTTPSVVFFEPTGEVTVGSSAKESSKMFPDESVAFIKRSIGKPNSNLIINGNTYQPEVISSYILKKIVNDAQDTLRQEGVLEENEEVKDVVITCPAYFGISERTATQQAGEIAGLNVLNIINEPTAAAITYGIVGNTNENNVVLVYDLGGGTFDITMIDISDNQIKVICTGGDFNLGGKDWDEKILLYLDDEYRKQTNSNDSVLDDPETLQELYLSVEKAKKLLSSKEKAPISINYNGNKVRVELTRDKFEELTSDLLERTIILTNEMIIEANKKGYKKEDIKEILLVGGSSKMPQVTKRVEKEFNIPVKMFDPDESVAKGAAIYAARQNEFNVVLDQIAENSGKTKEEIEKEISEGKDIKMLAAESNVDTSHRHYLGSTSDMKIINVTSRSFGIVAFDRNRNKMLFNLIVKNDELPAVAFDNFCPMQDGQKDVSLVVMENLSDEKVVDLSLGTEVGKTILELPPDIKASTDIRVEFKLNEDGLLELTAKETLSGKTISAKFETKDIISKEDAQRASEIMKNTTIN